MYEVLTAIALFASLQLINVILNSLKTLIMAKTDSPHASAIINAVTFGFYTLIVNYIAHMELIITIPVTIVTNVIGVYVTYAIFRKAKKDSLWKIEIWLPTPEDYQIMVDTLEVSQVPIRQDSATFLTVFAATQRQSGIVGALVKDWEKQGKPVKYNITEITKKF
jgi:hypothetical protein